MKRTLQMALAAALTLCSLCALAQSTKKAPEKSAALRTPITLGNVTPGPGDKSVDPITINQTQTSPQGERKELSYRSTRAVFSERAQGFIATFTASPDQAYGAQLNVFEDISKSDTVAPDGALPIRRLAVASDLTSIPLHTDATVALVHSDGTTTFLEVHGEFSLLAVPQWMRGARKRGTYSLIGTPGTRLNLAPLLESGTSLPLLGKQFAPAGPGEAILQITDRAIELLNVRDGRLESGAKPK
jgi:hypothetical protein